MYNFKEAFELLKEAEKACETKSSFFIFKKEPDWYTAAYNFEKAANMFRAGNNSEHAVESYIKAAEAFKRTDSMFLAAKNLENAASIYEKDKKFEAACENYENASNYYLVGNSPDKAGELLIKAGKAVENVNVDTALKCYKNACDLMDSEERGRLSIDTYKKAILIHLKYKKYNDTIELSKRLNNIYQSSNNRNALAKNQLSMIIIELSIGDEMGANKLYDEFCSTSGFGPTEEGIVASELLDAFEESNQEMLAKTTSKFVVTYLDNEIARLAKSLKVVGAVPYQPVAPQTNNDYNENNYNDYDQNNNYQNNNYQSNNYQNNDYQNNSNQNNYGYDDDDEGIC